MRSGTPGERFTCISSSSSRTAAHRCTQSRWTPTRPSAANGPGQKTFKISRRTGFHGDLRRLGRVLPVSLPGRLGSPRDVAHSTEGHRRVCARRMGRTGRVLRFARIAVSAVRRLRTPLTTALSHGGPLGRPRPLHPDGSGARIDTEDLARAPFTRFVSFGDRSAPAGESGIHRGDGCGCSSRLPTRRSRRVDNSNPHDAQRNGQSHVDLTVRRGRQAGLMAIDGHPARRAAKRRSAGDTISRLAATVRVLAHILMLTA